MGNLLIPPWAKILIPVLVVAAIFFAGFQVGTWKWSGTVEKAVAAREAAEAEAAEKGALEAQWRADVKRLAEDAIKAESAYAQLEADYLEATSRPPEIVVEYRDRIRTVTETIVSEDCKGGLGELYAFIASLPERPQ